VKSAKFDVYFALQNSSGKKMTDATYMTLAEMIKKKAALDALISHRMSEERGAAIKQVQAIIAEHALSPSDLFNERLASVAKESASQDGRKKVLPKYRDPDTGAEWTGRGRNPSWVTKALESGKSLQDFYIKDQEPQSE
jgi:DNA-binding protein H-NS